MSKSDFNKTLYIEESDGISIRNLYKVVCDADNKFTLKQIKKTNRQWQTVTNFFMDVFLPHGYPNSVSKDYLQYQIWDSVQAFASSITGSICTHAVLKGAGVGDESASPLAATITWLLKDGTSMVGRISFAWLQGTKLDSDCKKWRLFADVMNDVAMFLDLISAYFQSHFMLIICLSGLFKSIVGVAGSSTRAALTQHQARKNNMADVSAKDGSQETLVNLVALICSLVLVPIVTKSFVLTWIMYFSMTAVHLMANYFAVSSVIIETFNSARFKIYANHHFCQGGALQNLLSVEEVNKRESVLFSVLPKRIIIKLGSPFKEIAEGKSYRDLEKILMLYRECDYVLSYKNKASKVIIQVAFTPKATNLTEMEAMYQACYLDHILHNGSSDLSDKHMLYYITASRDHTKKIFADFLKCTKTKGFNTDTVYFNTDKWRIDW